MAAAFGGAGGTPVAPAAAAPAAAAAAPAAAEGEPGVKKYNFIISAHGEVVRSSSLIPIPQNFSIHTPPLGTVLVCSKEIQTYIGRLGMALDKAYHFNGPKNFKRELLHDYGTTPSEFLNFDIRFTPDERGEFKSGLVLYGYELLGGEPYVLTKIDKPIYLSELLREISSFIEGEHKRGDYKYNVQITVLACTSGSSCTGPERKRTAVAVPLTKHKPSGAGTERRKRSRRNHRKTRKSRK